MHAEEVEQGCCRACLSEKRAACLGQVLGETIEGRSLAILGQQPSSGSGEAQKWAGCDVMIMPAAAPPSSRSSSSSDSQQHAGAAEAGAFASEAAAKHLVLTGERASDVVAEAAASRMAAAAVVRGRRVCHRDRCGALQGSQGQLAAAVSRQVPAAAAAEMHTSQTICEALTPCPAGISWPSAAELIVHPGPVLHSSMILGVPVGTLVQAGGSGGGCARSGGASAQRGAAARERGAAQAAVRERKGRACRGVPDSCAGEVRL